MLSCYKQRAVLVVYLSTLGVPHAYVSAVNFVLGTQDGTGQGSYWLIECPDIYNILIAHI